MRYAILGPLEVYDGTQPLGIGGGRQRKLLGVLLVHANESVSSDRLIEELWDGEPPPTASKALQGLVSQLRKQLGPGSLETVAGGYLLRVAPGDTDAQQFEQLLREARPLDRGPALAKLRAALALWRGPALADFAYDDFARSEAERLEELRESCIERRIDLELALGHHDDLVPELESLVREYPLRERLRRHLILALYRSGRQADALQAYQDTRTMLREQLGLDPSDELQDLQKAILAHDPSLAPPPRVELPAGRERTGPPAPAARHRRRRALVVAAAGAALLLAAAIVAALELVGGGDSAPVVVPPNSVALIDSRRARVESFVGVGRRPVSLAVGATGVWVSNADDGTVDQLDPRTGRLVHTIGVGADVYTVAVGFGSVWVAGGNNATLTRIDPVLGQVQRTLSLGNPRSLEPNPVFFVATDNRYVWATRGAELLRIDPRTDQVDGRVAVGPATSLATGDGSVWVTTITERLVRVDSRSVEITASSVLSAAAIASVFGAGGLWLTDHAEAGNVDRIDPTSLGATTYGTSVGYPVALALGSGVLWVGNADGALERIEAGSGSSTAMLQVGAGLSALATDGDRVWVAVVGST
jgi:DNA-binding SARP family transcriptional activator/streptogramin lyase